MITSWRKLNNVPWFRKQTLVELEQSAVKFIVKRLLWTHGASQILRIFIKGIQGYSLMTSFGQEQKGIKIRKNSRRGEVWDSYCIKKIIV